jgi:hypothetical protein
MSLPTGGWNLSDLDSIPVACVRCQAENLATLEVIDRREAIECTTCGETFSIGDVFQVLYEQERLVRKSVDSIAEYATRQWAFERGATETRKMAEDFLQGIKFGDLLSETARQILVHGDAFLQIGKTWQLLPPQQVRVKTSLAAQHSSKALFIKDDEFVLSTETQTKSFVPEEVVHFKRTLLSERGPYGESKLLVVLTSLSHLRTFRSAPPRTQSEFQWWHDHLEEQVQLGLGVPDFVLEKRPLGYDRRVAEFVLASFVGEVSELQELLSSGFDEALERFANQRRLTKPPKLQLRKLTPRRVLLDCGFEFSKEIETLKKLHELGIIKKEELDQMLIEYKL